MKKVVWSPKLVENLKSFIQKGLMDKEIATKMDTTTNAIRLKRRKLLLFKRKTSFTKLSTKKQKKIMSAQAKKDSAKYRIKNLEKLQKQDREKAIKIRSLITINFNNGDRTAFWKYRIKQIKNNSAKKRKINVNLSPLDLENQWIKQSGKCFYTSEYLKAELPGKKIDKNNLVTIDRINSEIGYEKNNIRFVSYVVNTMKSNHSHQKFIELCQKIVNKNA